MSGSAGPKGKRRLVGGEDAFTIRSPCERDARALSELIRRSPPLDPNSQYCYLLLCTHFSATSAVACDRNDMICGGVTGYLRPDCADTLFIWQLVVDASARGQGLAGRLIEAVLQRPVCHGLRWLETTVGPSNDASAAVFARIALRYQVAVQRQPLFAASCFAAGHEEEILLRLGPFSAP